MAYHNMRFGYMRRVWALLKKGRWGEVARRLRAGGFSLEDLRHSHDRKQLAPEDFWRGVESISLKPRWEAYPNILRVSPPT